MVPGTAKVVLCYSVTKGFSWCFLHIVPDLGSASPSLFFSSPSLQQHRSLLISSNLFFNGFIFSFIMFFIIKRIYTMYRQVTKYNNKMIQHLTQENINTVDVPSVIIHLPWRLLLLELYLLVIPSLFFKNFTTHNRYSRRILPNYSSTKSLLFSSHSLLKGNIFKSL